MSRFVMPVSRLAKGAVAGAPSMDGYFDRVVKYIPTEIVGAYLAILGMVSEMAQEGHKGAVAHLIVFVACWALVFGYLYWRMPTGNPLWPQIGIAMVAFPVWVYAIGGGALKDAAWHDPRIGSIVLVLFSLGVGLYQPSAAPPPPPPPPPSH